MSDENPYAPPVASLTPETKPQQFSLVRIFRGVAYVFLPFGLVGLLCEIYFTGGLLTFLGLIFLVAAKKSGG